MIYDLLVVGAGPAGLSAACHAKKEGLSVLILEKGELANTIFDYQKKKHVMAEPGIIPLRSDVMFEAGPREQILQACHDACRKFQVQINRPELVQEVVKKDAVFHIRSDKATYQAQHVILAIGVQGNPNRVGRPGEDLPHVTYKLTDPFAYKDLDIMMVGAGDAAIEGVLALCENNRVSVINRSTEFYRLKDALDRQINEQVKAKKVVVHHSAIIDRFEPGYTVVSIPDGVVRVKTDLVVIRIGAALPRPFLEKCGVTFPSQDRNALPILSEHSESSVPGLYIIGAAAGFDLIKEGMNQGYEVVEHILGRQIEPVEEMFLKEKLNFLEGSTNERLDYIARTIPLLAKVQKQPLWQLLLDTTVHQLPPWQDVFKENDFTDSLYMVLDGEVGCTFSWQRSEASPVLVKAGAFFGEMSLFSGRQRSGTVTTVTPATLLEVPRKAMLRLMANEPSVKRFLDETFIARAMQTYLFQDTVEDFERELAHRAEIKFFQKDEVIFKEGDIGDAFYLIRSGSVKLSKREREREIVLKYLPAGEFFGEIALLNSQNSRRTATVTATTLTEVILLRKDDFDLMLEKFPDLARTLRETMERRLIEHQALQLMASRGSDELDELLKEGVFQGTDVLLIDERKCVRCDNCVTACAATHNGQTRLYLQGGVLFGTLKVPTSCRHCENPLCLTDCPPGDAIRRDPKGEVYVDEAKCIGCGNCAAHCPYGVIFMMHQKPKTGALGRLLGLIGLASEQTTPDEHPIKAVKCDLCRSDPAGPACVRSCPTGAAFRVNPTEFFDRIQAVGD
jgi:CRP-like cAMP-binding protein/thioredoxin reductase/Fe-S-cluster-containing hydrogenase component 2